MAHDVFVSHSTRDKSTADAICAVLEGEGIRCWVAPRDIIPGREYGASIIEAIRSARVMVLVFSSHANQSPQINREVERAVHRGIPVIPVRIEDVVPTDSLEYLISTPHWLDAFTPPLERHLRYLAQVIRQIMDGPDKKEGGPAPQTPGSAPAAVPPPPPDAMSTPSSPAPATFTPPAAHAAPAGVPTPAHTPVTHQQPAHVPTTTHAPTTAAGAIWSLILGIIGLLTIAFCGGFLLGIPAIICGHVAHSSIRKSHGTRSGSGMAITGLVLGYIAVVLSFIIIPLFAIPFYRGFEKSMSKSTASTQPTPQISATPWYTAPTSPSPSPQTSSGVNEIKSTDGSFGFNFPSAWKTATTLNDAASLQAANKANDEYIIVISESKADFDNTMSLKKHHQITRDATLKRMQNSSATKPETLTIDGHSALQDEISGSQEGTNIVFLHTTIDDGSHYHQILAWTVKSRWSELSDELREVTATFHTSQ